jgi:hypothetical protein
LEPPLGTARNIAPRSERINLRACRHRLTRCEDRYRQNKGNKTSVRIAGKLFVVIIKKDFIANDKSLAATFLSSISFEETLSPQRLWFSRVSDC